MATSFQMIVVKDLSEAFPEEREHRHGLAPPMREVRKRRFKREPEMNVSFLYLVEITAVLSNLVLFL